MKITKYLHSCLLVEEKNKIILIDPGNYTFEENAIDLIQIPHLDAVVITHEHDDHLYLPMIQNLLKKFPNTPIYTNSSVKQILSSKNIPSLTTSNDSMFLSTSSHERSFDKPKLVENIQIEFCNLFCDPGDSLQFKTSLPILAIPLRGPSWSFTQAVEKVLEVKPKYVIPVHDYHWKDSIRKQIYKRLEVFLSKENITFLSLEVGEPVIIDL